MKLLTRAEEMVLLAVWQLNEKAYSISIREKIHEFSGETWSLGTIFAPLERLEKRKYISSYLSESTPERGGRQKRLYKITRFGKEALVRSRRMQLSMWEGIPELSGKADI